RLRRTGLLTRSLVQRVYRPALMVYVDGSGDPSYDFTSLCRRGGRRRKLTLFRLAQPTEKAFLRFVNEDASDHASMTPTAKFGTGNFPHHIFDLLVAFVEVRFDRLEPD